MMEEIAASGDRAQQSMQLLTQKREALAAQWTAALAQYESDFAPLAPVFSEYMKQSDPAGNAAQARQLAQQYDAGYRTLCAKWFTGANSPFLAYLAALKRFLVEDLIPVEEEGARFNRAQLDINGINSATYKSTSPIEAVAEYLSAMMNVFGKRAGSPLSVQSD
jgi:hypothetical protein